MTPLLLIALAALPPQEGIEERFQRDVRAYTFFRTPAEERPRILERLVALGPAAVGYIQKSADRSGPPEGVRPIRYLANEVKIALLSRANDPRGAAALRALRGRIEALRADDASLEMFLDLFRRRGVMNLLVNPPEQRELADLRLSFRSPEEEIGEVLDRVLSPRGLDYSARGSLVVIARRSWLWGPPPAAELDAAGKAGIDEAIKDLEAELADRRAAAERTIVESGPGAIPYLEKLAVAATPPHRERLRAFAARILVRSSPDRLHPPESAATRSVDEGTIEIRSLSQTRTISISFIRPTPFSEIVARISEFGDLPVEIDAALGAGVADRPLTLAVDRCPILDALEAIAIPLGAAVQAGAGKLRIVPKP